MLAYVFGGVSSSACILICVGILFCSFVNVATSIFGQVSTRVCVCISVAHISFCVCLCLFVYKCMCVHMYLFVSI